MRSSIVSLSLACGAVVLGTPAIAAADAAPSSKAVPAATSKSEHAEGGTNGPTTKVAPNFDAMLSIFDKMFPPQSDPDPARLELARLSAQPMWPDGAYGNMMKGLLGGMFDRVMLMKASDFAALSDKVRTTGANAAKADLSIHDQAAANDPHFDQRMAAMRDILDQEMIRISAVVDPRMRDGLARAMARRFDVRQLTDINAFFATPSGHAMASQYMQLWLDPDMIRSMTGSLPQMMKLMPEMSERLKAVQAEYPKPAAASAKPAKN